MKISFNKVARSPSKVEFSDKDGLHIGGTLLKEGVHKVHFVSTITGDISLTCDRCGKDYKDSLNLPLDLILTDQVQKVMEDLDTIELLDGIIDIGLLMESEIASYRSNYHYCQECRQSEEELDIEY